jgi:hypothetical protein
MLERRMGEQSLQETDAPFDVGGESRVHRFAWRCLVFMALVLKAKLRTQKATWLRIS